MEKKTKTDKIFLTYEQILDAVDRWGCERSKDEWDENIKTITSDSESKTYKQVMLGQALLVRKIAQHNEKIIDELKMLREFMTIAFRDNYNHSLLLADQLQIKLDNTSKDYCKRMIKKYGPIPKSVETMLESAKRWYWRNILCRRMSLTDWQISYYEKSNDLKDVETSDFSSYVEFYFENKIARNCKAYREWTLWIKKPTK